MPKIFFFGMTLLHAHVYFICIVCAKYQKASVKALVQIDFLMYALSKNKHRKQEKTAKFTKLSFCQKLIFWHQTSSHKCSMCLQHYHLFLTVILSSLTIDFLLLFSRTLSITLSHVYAKYQTVSAKAVVQVDFPAYALSIHKQNALRITKGNNSTEWPLALIILIQMVILFFGLISVLRPFNTF